MSLSLQSLLFNLLDPASLGLISIAVSAIYYGSWRATKRYAGTSNIISRLEHTNVIHTYLAIALPIIGSIVLVVLFLFLHILFYLIMALFTLSALGSSAYVVDPYSLMLIHWLGWSPFIKFFKWKIPTELILNSLCSIIVVGAWYLTWSWIVVDLLAFCIAVLSLNYLRLTKAKVATIILVLFLIYDVFWVFLSPYVTPKGENVMKDVAENLTDVEQHIPLPIAIMIPRVFSDYYSLLGLGDIVLPGIYLCFLFRFDLRNGLSVKRGYFIYA